MLVLMPLFVAAYNADISSQLKAARQQAEVSRQELTEYKEKAARILQVLSVLIGLPSVQSSELALVIRKF